MNCVCLCQQIFQRKINYQAIIRVSYNTQQQEEVWNRVSVIWGGKNSVPNERLADGQKTLLVPHGRSVQTLSRRPLPHRHLSAADAVHAP